jgi:hypothetical protein
MCDGIAVRWIASVSRSGKSSGELGSMMILNSLAGNGLSNVDPWNITRNE